MDDIYIRPMLIEDYDNIYKLWTLTKGMGLNNLDDTKTGINIFLQRNPNTCFVATLHNKIIGTIITGHDGRRGGACCYAKYFLDFSLQFCSPIIE